ncbi:MAG: histidine phosphotransferase family protein, partial [Arenibacterium sp.]
DVSIDIVDDRWIIKGTTSKLNLELSLWRGLLPDFNATDVTPAQVQFVLFPSAARELGRDIRLDHDETSVTIAF